MSNSRTRSSNHRMRHPAIAHIAKSAMYAAPQSMQVLGIPSPTAMHRGMWHPAQSSEVCAK
ncbi:MAG: hypothetical protein LAO31_15220 [Acidobacteriia bacterium]|nr:hypothetical protein [Terriglobia bacterium]